MTGPRPFRIAARVAGLPANCFAATDAKVAKARGGGVDVIDLSKANPDGRAPAFVARQGAAAMLRDSNFRYGPFDGKARFLEAAAGWYAREHGVALDPASQVTAVEGASVGLAAVTQSLLDPGDALTVVEPYYPPYLALAAAAGARFRTIRATAGNGYLPDLGAVDPSVWDDTALLLLNFPANPTGAMAGRAFFGDVLALSRVHGFAVINDFAYAGIGYRTRPVSLLSATRPGDLAAEICSMSKMYTMAGWRAGFIAGDARLIGAFRRYHHQLCSSVAAPVQDAAAAALDSDQSTVRDLAARYASRHRLVAEGLRESGIDVFDSSGALYAWARVPDGCTSQGFADLLLERANVAVLPGTCFGEGGEGYVRISLLMPEERLREAVSRIAETAIACGYAG